MHYLLLLLLLMPAVLTAQTVATSSGQLQGNKIEGVFAFKGIPFAQAPVGDLRWQSPREQPSWEGVRDATEYGDDCMQSPYPKGSPYYRALRGPSEDCLYLNVWSTELASDRKAPVLVWIHGGGLTRGSGSNPVYDGSEFARRNVVLVTINYRLNVFGYLAHPWLSAEQNGVSGNYGLQDQVAALRWVRDNIAAFGGNPDNVTIFGESAGSWSVNQLMVNPEAEGLFHRAIGQSGGMFRTLPLMAEQGYARGEKISKHLDSSSLEVLRDASAADVMSAYVALEKSGSRLGGMVDGRHIPDQALALFQSGQYNQVPVMVGYNRDEATVFALAPGSEVSGQRADFAEGLAKFAPALKSEFLAAYPEVEDLDPRKPGLDFRRDMSFGWNMYTWARLNEQQGNPAWLYFFTRVPPTPAGKMLGSYHAAEIVYVFGNNVPDTAEDRGLSDAMQQFWVNFAAFGHPNGKAPQFWPRYGRNGSYLQIDIEPRLGRGLSADAMKVWDKLAGVE